MSYLDEGIADINRFIGNLTKSEQLSVAQKADELRALVREDWRMSLAVSLVTLEFSAQQLAKLQ